MRKASKRTATLQRCNSQLIQKKNAEGGKSWIIFEKRNENVVHLLHQMIEIDTPPIKDKNCET